MGPAINMGQNQKEGICGSWYIKPLEIKNETSRYKEEDRREMCGLIEDLLSVWFNRLLKKSFDFIPGGEKYNLKELLGARSPWVPSFATLQLILCARQPT